MLKQLRQQIIQELWQTARHHSTQIKIIEEGLKQKGISKLFLDHFAVIDLPGPHTGIPYLTKLFTAMGYITRGKDYLADKQNDFLWMCEAACMDLPAHEVLPQAVVADFRLEEMPLEIKKIIEKYSYQASPLPLEQIQHLVEHNDENSFRQLHEIILKYFTGRDWPLPTVKEFHTVQEFNELLAWVLIFGRQPNHFTLSIHLLNQFDSLEDFHRFIVDELQLLMNVEGGIIKGSKAAGIAQGSTAGMNHTVKLADGHIEIPTSFVEFVWRFPHHSTDEKPLLWKDYFTGFIPQHADRVIESLYT